MPPDVLDEPVEVLLELPGEPRLPDPGHADDRDETRALVVRGRVEEVLDQPELAVAAHERRLEPDRAHLAAPRADDARRTPEPHGLCFPFQLVRACVLVDDRGLRGPFRRLADEDASGLRRALDARGRVHEVAGDHPVPFRPERDRCLAGEHPGPRSQLGRTELLAEQRDSGDEVERRAHRTLGIVLLRDRGAPDRHDGIADELLDRAAIALDDLPRAVEISSEDLSCLLRVTVLRCGREPNEIGEQHRHQAALGHWWRCSGDLDRDRFHGSTAVAAELLAGLDRAPTGGARHCQRGSTISAELLAGWVFGAAGRTVGHAKSVTRKSARS